MLPLWPFRPGPAPVAGLDVADATRPPTGVEMVKGEWPGIRATQGDSAEAGPTGAPWVDSNGWVIRLACLRHPEKTIWVDCEPPKANEVIPANRLALGLADAAAHGGRWIVPLGSRTEVEALVPAMRFFDAHRDWADYQPRAVLGFISDFAGPNEFLGQELLNLTARRHLPYRIFDKTKPISLVGLKAAVYPDAGPPPSALRTALVEFARAGGLVVARAAFGAEGPPLREQPLDHWDVRSLGKGRLALGKSDPDDPYAVANDIHILLSRRNDLLRFYNAGAWGDYLTTAPDGRTVLHLINYTGFPSRSLVTVWIAGAYRSATLHTFDGTHPLTLTPARGGVEIHTPPVTIYAAVELAV